MAVPRGDSFSKAAGKTLRAGRTTAATAVGSSFGGSYSLRSVIGASLSGVYSVMSEGGGSAADDDWLARSTAPGVIYANGFNTQSDFGPNVVSNPAATYYWNGSTLNGIINDPVVSSTEKCSGTGCIEFTVPSNWGGQNGSWSLWFGDFFPVGENDEIYIQFRTRWNAGTIEASGQNQGTKFAFLFGSYSPSSGHVQNSQNYGCIMQTYQASAIPTTYTAAMLELNGTYHSQQGFENIPTNDVQPGSQWGYCTGTERQNLNTVACWAMPPDEWVTFTYYLKRGVRRSDIPYVNSSSFADITFWLKAQIGTDPPFKIIDWFPGCPGYMPIYVGTPEENFEWGNLEFLPYISFKTAGQRPSANQIQTNFTGGFAEIDEFTRDDSDFAYSANGGGTLRVKVSGNPPYAPHTTGSGYTFAKVNNGALDNSGNVVTVTARIYQGNTLIATDAAQTCTGSWQFRKWTTNTNAVTDWNDTYMEFTFADAGGGSPRGGAISYAVLGGVHDEGKVWYDELILSTQPIANPTTAGDGGAYPAWRQGLPSNQLSALTGTQQYSGMLPNIGDPINAWHGFATDGHIIYSAGGTGHGGWWNPVCKLNLDQSNPQWEVLDPGSDFADAVEHVSFYRDGRPTAVHTYFASVYSVANGIPRIILPRSDAGYALGGDPFPPSNVVTAFRLDGWTGDTGTPWEVTGSRPSNWSSMWPDDPSGLANGSAACTIHPVTGVIYICGGEVSSADGATRAYRTFDPATQTWSGKIVTTPAYPDLGTCPTWQDTPSVIDVSRNLWVSLNGRDPFSGGYVTPRFVRINLATSQVTQIALSGDAPTTAAAAIVHNTDDDFYYVLTSDSTAPNMRIYKIDPDTGASEKIFESTTAAHCVVGGNAPYTRFIYHSWLRGFTWAPQWNSPLYFLPL